MRAIADTLTNAQQSTSVKALVKLVLTHNSTTYTYTKTRILDIKETEDGPLQRLEITLNNSDGTLTDLDLKGYQGVLSNGVVTSQGEEYDACAPMWVLSHEFNSDPKKLECTLFLKGICNLMQMDAASEAYQPDSDDTKSVKTLVDSIVEATIDCFSHCTAYDTVWEYGYDGLADTYIPKDAFRIYVGNNRLSKINQLLNYTKNVAVVKADGKLHIFEPTTSGETYDYEYSLKSGHPFFAKALRNTLVIPNYVKVQSREDDDPKYSGTATDATSNALLPKAQYKQTYLASDEQAEDIAEAILAKAQMWCEAGAADVPMNVGAEVYDYVKVTDEREDDYRVGNIGRYVRHYNVKKNEWRMAFDFGNWQNVRKALDQLGITADDLENYFSRLQVGDLYVENILADNLDFVWIDPDGNIDLSKIGDTLDNLADGETYGRVLQTHIDAGGIKISAHTIFSAGYDPTLLDLDDIADGTTFQRVQTASLTAAGLVLLDQVVVGTYGLVKSTAISAGYILLSKTVKDGEWYEESGVAIDATKGIAIFGGEGLSGLRTYPTATDYANDTNVQCYIGTDGKLYAGGGKVSLDSNGILIDNSDSYTNRLRFKFDENFAEIFYIGLSLCLSAGSGGVISFYVGATPLINIYDEAFYPSDNNTATIGTVAKQFYGGYFKSRLMGPVGTDMYD